MKTQKKLTLWRIIYAIKIGLISQQGYIENEFYKDFEFDEYGGCIQQFKQISSPITIKKNQVSFNKIFIYTFILKSSNYNEKKIEIIR